MNLIEALEACRDNAENRDKVWQIATEALAAAIRKCIDAAMRGENK